MSAVPAPSGAVTFLFTGIEGSTRRWESDADGMRVSLADHDEVLRSAIQARGGFLFKHTGRNHRRVRVQSDHQDWVTEISRVIIHLRDALGEQTYESFAGEGKAMTTAETARCAYDQIDQARSELNAPTE
ncbi:hypothetical protein [Mycobacterium arosiense]|uniref:hypothetical protein n=1 Tax=Mycobacterium arosiense TaxID=425468 RepID=UPI00114E4B27|nr:hypothetical protein [Mycobacterium arosiense]